MQIPLFPFRRMLRLSSRFKTDRFDELGRVNPPPKLLLGHGGPQFRDIGRRWVETFQLIASLSPTAHVLDVGCGPGRMALELAPYLRTSGRYEGFDIRAADIAWCKKEIEPRWSRSRFQLVDVNNAHYNASGELAAEAFRFPYPDQSFDFVFMTSVCTHLRSRAVSNYLGQASRVLKAGGRCLASFFLVNERVWARIAAGKSRFQFAHAIGPSTWSQYADRPERVVAYEETFIRTVHQQAGLAVCEPMHYGAWSGDVPPGTRHSQDVVVAFKPGSAQHVTQPAPTFSD
ncbi:MAG: class I SAM-dependent methyltransferase [Pirellulales bacterium]